MNFDDIQSVWNTPANQMDTETARQLKQALAQRLRRQRRTEIVWLLWTGFLLTVITVQVGNWVFLSGKFRLSADWLLLPLLIVPWTLLVSFSRRFFTRRNAEASRSIPDALRVALSENRAAQAKHKAIAALQLVFVLILPLLMYQLHLAGKASVRELVCMAILFGGALAVAAGLMAFKYFRRLRPEQKRMETLLRSYEH